MQQASDPSKDRSASSSSSLTRRHFLQTSAATSAAVTMAAMGTNWAHAAGSETIRVGLVGCGGRGTGAARDCAGHNEGVKIVSMGEVFQDRLDKSRGNLKELGPDRFDVKDDQCFIGFDAYEKVIASDVDLVILATPPGFRPRMIKAAAEAGKHIFAEKPVAVDPTGIRIVLEANETIKGKNLGFVAGTQRRHQGPYREIIKRIHDGAIGEVVSGSGYWNQQGLWMHPRQPEWSDMEWQLRNWLYFTWLSGDHIVEQHVHQIDVMNWVMKGPPKSAYSMGGRQTRTDPAYGHIYDHFATEFDYGDGIRWTSFARQQDGTDPRVDEFVRGSTGYSDPGKSISGKNEFRYRKSEDELGPYQQEHVDLINSIRAGKPLNECRQVAESTLSAIMGRMSAYTGKLVTWEQALNSELDTFPKGELAMGSMPVPPVPMPGKEPLV